MDNKNFPAFPIVMRPGTDEQESFGGMTKREWFAGMALAGQLAHIDNAPTSDFEGAAKYCVKMVDALLAELEKQPASDKK